MAGVADTGLLEQAVAELYSMDPDGFIDRRERKQAWAKDDNERQAKGLPPRGVVSFRVLDNAETETEPEHHG